MSTISRRQHEKHRLIFCVLGYALAVAAFYATKWSHDVTTQAFDANYSLLGGAQFPFLYTLCVVVLAYLVSFVDLLYKDF